MIENGTCIIDGGEISDNQNKGILVVSNGNVTMLNGKISDNFSPDGAGGVGISNGGQFTMSGGNITFNSATVAGGVGYSYLLEYNFGGIAGLYFADKTFGVGVGIGS